MTDSRGFRSEWIDSWLRPFITGRTNDPSRPSPARRKTRSFASLLDQERGSSFMYTGGIVGVHAAGRSREAIWKALEQKAVYGTSGPRILLWFDLLNGPEGRVSMGGEVGMDRVPRFEVRAVGSFVQRPGCPEESVHGLSAQRLERLCRGECYNPSDERRSIAAIEVVRVRPRNDPGESLEPLIEDPWKSFPCEPDPAGCVATFEDPDFADAARDAVYYVRALEEPTAAINGANLRTTFDADGQATGVSPCYGGYATPADDDCLAPVSERAWSSPIFVDFSG